MPVSTCMWIVLPLAVHELNKPIQHSSYFQNKMSIIAPRPAWRFWKTEYRARFLFGIIVKFFNDKIRPLMGGVIPHSLAAHVSRLTTMWCMVRIYMHTRINFANLQASHAVIIDRARVCIKFIIV